MTNERKVDGESRGRLLDDIADIAHQHERKLAFEKLVAEAAAAERKRVIGEVREFAMCGYEEARKVDSRFGDDHHEAYGAEKAYRAMLAKLTELEGTK